MKLLIDDTRECPFEDFWTGRLINDVDVTCRTFDDGIDALKSQKWDMLYLDHDLGDEQGRTGYDIMLWLEKNPEYCTGKIFCVSINPSGRDRINHVIRKLYNGRK